MVRLPDIHKAPQTAKSEEAPKCRIDIACAKKSQDVLEMAAARLGWATTNGGGGEIVWVVTKEEVVEGLRRCRGGGGGQQIERLSHIPGMLEACGKIALSEALQVQGVSFWPRTWSIPQVGADEVWCDAASSSLGGGGGGGATTLIVKPDCGTQGHGIALAHSREELRLQVARLLGRPAVVQEYVGRPLLLDGYKWDARIYALVMPSPRGGLMCFFAHEGLARFCVDCYEPPDARNVHRRTVHLTNYSLSKFSDKYAHNKDPHNGNHGCKRTLSAVLRRLETEAAGFSAEAMWRQLAAIVRQTVEAMTEPLLAAAFEAASWEGSAEVAGLAREHFGCCFQILGLDVLLGEDGKPWLLEVNNNPSLSIDEVRPLSGAQTRAEVNKLFASAVRRASSMHHHHGGGGVSGSVGLVGGCQIGSSGAVCKLGRPCRCAQHPRVHTHANCPVDVAVKLPIVEGALAIAHRAITGDEPVANLVEGTLYELVQH